MIWNVNTKAMCWVIKETARQMIAQGPDGGASLQADSSVGSIASRKPLVDGPFYCTSEITAVWRWNPCGAIGLPSH